jgi:hypothetical protein
MAFIERFEVPGPKRTLSLDGGSIRGIRATALREMSVAENINVLSFVEKVAADRQVMADHFSHPFDSIFCAPQHPA